MRVRLVLPSDGRASRGAVYGFLLFLVVLGGGFYYFHQNYEIKEGSVQAKSKAAEKTASEKKADEATPIRVSAATVGSIDSHVASTANLRALRNVSLLSQATGVVEKIFVEEGNFVQQGKLLCLLDDRELQIDLELAKQRLEQTKVQLESARITKDKIASQIGAKQSELERNTKALQEGLVSDTDVELLKNQLEELKHDERAQGAAVRESEYHVDELSAEIDKVQVQIQHTRITAPFPGRIVERTVELGQTIRANDPLFKLASFSPLYADVFISELDSRRVKPGQDVRVTLDTAGDNVSLGKVVRVSPVVDDATGTVKVTAELRNPAAALRPGAFVRVSIKTDTVADAVLIPKSAVLEEDGESYVFIADGETARRKKVELGYESGASVEVRSGVSAGDRVVVAGQGSLKEGDKTKVMES